MSILPKTCTKCGRFQHECVCIEKIILKPKVERAFVFNQKLYTIEEVLKLCRSYAQGESCDDNWSEEKWIQENLLK